MDIGALVRVAIAAKGNARAPLSGFRVGAGVYTDSGAIFEGCNTECLIPALGVCAERNAINHAIIHGESGIVAVAIVSDMSEALAPCGACLQYLQEFALNSGRDILIVSEGASGHRMVTSVHELLKGGFAGSEPFHGIQQSMRWTTEE